MLLVITKTNLILVIFTDSIILIIKYVFLWLVINTVGISRLKKGAKWEKWIIQYFGKCGNKVALNLKSGTKFIEIHAKCIEY